MNENTCGYCGGKVGNHDYDDKNGAFKKGDPFELCAKCNEKFRSHKITKCPKCGGYTDTDIIGALTAVCDELSHGIFNVMLYHDNGETQALTEQAYAASQNMVVLFNEIIRFFQSKEQNDMSARKASLIYMTNYFSSVPESTIAASNSQSSIETLLLEALTITKSESLKRSVSIRSQVDVCGGKYRLDIALSTLDAEKEEFDILLGIECDGYDYHNSSPEKSTESYRRINEIKMRENIEIFTFTGSDIYKNCIEIARNIWKYAEDLYNRKFPERSANVLINRV